LIIGAGMKGKTFGTLLTYTGIFLVAASFELQQGLAIVLIWGGHLFWEHYDD